MFKKMIIFTILFNMLGISSSQACTAWGAITPHELLIAKNRDFFPGYQAFKTTSTSKFKIFGLHADNIPSTDSPVRMGINEKGLVVFMTFASTLPLALRNAKIPYNQVMENILGNYDSVDQINKNSNLLFNNSTPINYLFADRKKSMICEIGLNNNYQCKVYARNSHKVVTFSQTNHYIFPELKQYNYTPVQNQQTSYYRLNKINELMNQNLSNLTLKKFIRFSFDTTSKNDNPLADFDVGYNNTYQDNSIFRTFNSHPDRKYKNHSDSDQSVSTMIVQLPKNENQPITLYLRIINSIQDLNDKQYTQIIRYREAKTTLERAINHPDTIEYIAKTCKRDLTSKQCS